MDKIEIEDPMMGKRAGATCVTLAWLSKPFFTNEGTIRVTWQKEDVFSPGNYEYLDHQDIVVDMAAYYATGETKAARADVVLNDLGVVKRGE